jgi:large-conductance mechanosensitive channel
MDITSIAVAIYFGVTISKFFQAITRDLVTPVIGGLLPGAQQNLDKVVINVGPVKLDIGNMISAVLDLVIAYFVISMTLPYIRTYTPLGGKRA